MAVVHRVCCLMFSRSGFSLTTPTLKRPREGPFFGHAQGSSGLVQSLGFLGNTLRTRPDDRTNPKRRIMVEGRCSRAQEAAHVSPVEFTAHYPSEAASRHARPEWAAPIVPTARTPPRILYLKMLQGDRPPSRTNNNRVHGRYKNDLQNALPSCPKKKEFIRFESAFCRHLESYSHSTPRHGSWLNVAECERSCPTSKCLSDRRIGDLQSEITARATRTNAKQRAVDWQFTIDKARVKLNRLYPKI
jgi:hypothetical protein